MEGINRVYIYSRVSTKGQVDENGEHGIGIQAQKEILSAYYGDDLADQLHYEPVFIQDVGSSFNNQSKLVNLDSMIAEMPVRSLILVHDISRLGRNVYQVFKNIYEPVELKQCMIFSFLENKFFGRNRREDLDFFHATINSEGFSIGKSEAMKAILDYVSRNGGHVGGIPFGKKLKRGVRGIHRLVNDPIQQRAIRRIKSMCDRGKTTREIYNTLAEFPTYNYRGKPISIHKIREIVRLHKESNPDNELADDMNRMTA